MFYRKIPFKVFDEKGKEIHGEFILTQDGILQKINRISDPEYPNIEHQLVENYDHDDLEIKFQGNRINPVF